MDALASAKSQLRRYDARLLQCEAQCAAYSAYVTSLALPDLPQLAPPVDVEPGAPSQPPADVSFEEEEEEEGVVHHVPANGGAVRGQTAAIVRAGVDGLAVLLPPGGLEGADSHLAVLNSIAGPKLLPQSPSPYPPPLWASRLGSVPEHEEK